MKAEESSSETQLPFRTLTLRTTFDNQQELTDELARTASTVRLLISISKTKLLHVSAGGGTVKPNREHF